MTAARSTVSPFADYLALPDVQEKLQQNIAHHSRNDLQTSNPYEILHRIFNDLPLDYNGMQPFLSLLDEAIGNNELDLWLTFVVFKAITDLFDDNGHIQEDMYHFLNARQSGKKQGALDYIKTQIEEPELNAGILSSYLMMVGDIILKQVMQYHANVSGSLLDESHPLTQSSIAINQRARNMNHIDKDYIAGIKSMVEAAAKDETIKSTRLADAIRQFLANPATFSVANNKMTLFASVKAAPTTSIKRLYQLSLLSCSNEYDLDDQFQALSRAQPGLQITCR